MNFLLDAKTVFLSIAIGHFFTAILVVTYWSQHRMHKSVQIFSLAKCAQACAWFFLVVRGGLNDLFTLSLSNTLLLAGTALEAAALLSLQQWMNRSVLRLWGAATAANILGFHLLLLTRAEEPVRIAFASIGTAVLLVFIAYPMIMTKHASLLTKVMGCFYGAVVAGSVIRAAAALFTDIPTGFFASGATHSVTLLMLYLIMMAENVGFFLLMKEQSDRELTRLAHYDELTDTLNRRAFVANVGNQIRLHADKHEPLSLLLFDVDEFKTINDTHGHDAGDRVLRSLVDRIKPRLGTEDLLSRYGGDEFMVLLPGRNVAESTRIAEDLRHVVEQTDHLDLAVRHTISIGAITVVPGPGTLFETLYTACDKALYDAKKAGRNRMSRAGL